MARLKDRNRQIPGSLRFYDPALKWQSTPWASFDSIVRSLMAVRQGNPRIAALNHWPTTYEDTALEVDMFNAAICEKMGWSEFYVADGGQPAMVPFHQSQPQFNPLQKLASAVAGVETIKEMFGPEGPEPNQELVKARAKVCLQCPRNEKGLLSSFFTEPVSAMIRAALSRKVEMGLKTEYDDQLHVCSACLCPMRLKVWARINHILAKIPQDNFNTLWSDCWIRKEKNV